MPFTVDLYIRGEGALPSLLRCPGIRALVEAAEDPTALDVTALALEEDAGGTAYPLTPEDAASLDAEGDRRVLLPGRAKYEDGASAEGFAGTLRVPFLGWIRKVARELRCPLELVYRHERGDWLYEMASWYFVPAEELSLHDFDGDEEPVWSAMIELAPPRGQAGLRVAEERRRRARIRRIAALVRAR